MWCIFAFFILFSKIEDSENVSIRMKAFSGYASSCNITQECNSPSLQCDNGLKKCVCAKDYEFDDDLRKCVPCPTLGDPCQENCFPSDNFKCINGRCEICFETSDVRRCSSHNLQNQHLLLTATQIAMTGALILGILTIFTLFWKLCSKSTYRQPAARRQDNSRNRGRISVNSNGSTSSLQRVITERLRDAPPPYCRASLPLPPPGDTPPPYNLLPNDGYVNATFEMECNIPPPAYSVVENQIEETENEQHKIQTAPTNIEPKENETLPTSAALHM